ncbi:MAG: hypothetical protein ACLQMF_20210 [Rectinemataceae bacterium]
MTPLAIGQLLGSVIATFMSLDPSRVVIKDESFDAPKDQGIYILIEYEGPKIIGVSSHFDPATLTETLSQSSHEHFTIEVVSRGSGAMTAFPQVLLALASTAATQAAESAGVSFWRGGDPLDVSEVEGSGPLRRYRIPVVLSNLQFMTVPVPDIENFRAIKLDVEA